MTGNRYSAVRRSIATLLASEEGRAVFALNKYTSGTPIVLALKEESLDSFYKRLDETAGPGQDAVAAVLLKGQLQLAKVSPSNSVVTSNDAAEPKSLTADPKATVGMLFAELARSHKLAVKIQPFDYDTGSKVAVSFDMPDRGGSLQHA